MQLGFNLSNRATDTLESSSILIYLIHEKGIYTQKGCADSFKEEINKEEHKRGHHCKLN